MASAPITLTQLCVFFFLPDLQFKFSGPNLLRQVSHQQLRLELELQQRHKPERFGWPEVAGSCVKPVSASNYRVCSSMITERRQTGMRKLSTVIRFGISSSVYFHQDHLRSINNKHCLAVTACTVSGVILNTPAVTRCKSHGSIELLPGESFVPHFQEVIHRFLKLVLQGFNGAMAEHFFLIFAFVMISKKR